MPKEDSKIEKPIELPVESVEALQAKVSMIETKLQALETVEGRQAFISEKLSKLQEIPENQLSDSMRWLVQNVKQRLQAQDEKLLALEQEYLLKEKMVLEAKLEQVLEEVSEVKEIEEFRRDG